MHNFKIIVIYPRRVFNNERRQNAATSFGNFIVLQLMKYRKLPAQLNLVET